MPTQPALAIASAFLDAFTRQDFETAGGYLADDFTFDGPVAHYRSANEFLEGSRAFAQRIRPGWEKVAAFGNDEEALLLYDLTLVNDATMRIADHYRVHDGTIVTESILWDTGRTNENGATKHRPG